MPGRNVWTFEQTIIISERATLWMTPSLDTSILFALLLSHFGNLHLGYLPLHFNSYQGKDYSPTTVISVSKQPIRLTCSSVSVPLPELIFCFLCAVRSSANYQSRGQGPLCSSLHPGPATPCWSYTEPLKPH